MIQTTILSSKAGTSTVVQSCNKMQLTKRSSEHTTALVLESTVVHTLQFERKNVPHETSVGTSSGNVAAR